MTVRHVLPTLLLAGEEDGVAVALEPYNNVSLSFLCSTHSSGMLNCMRARASVRETVVAVCELVRLSSGAVHCTVCR
jgi:hypothetical protein